MSTTQEHSTIPSTAVEFAPITDVDLALAGELAQQLRVDSIRSSTSAGSGHPTSSMSAADLLAVLVHGAACLERVPGDGAVLLRRCLTGLGEKRR